MAYDDDDWTGEPPEGRNVSDPARIAYWRSQWQRAAIGAGLLMAIAVVVVVVSLI